MSIAPPSDIVLDVAQAADPLKLQAATAKLARMAAGAGAAGTDFDAALAATGAASPPAEPPANGFGLGLGTTLWRTTPAVHPQGASAYQKFEAVILQNFVQNILPKDENLFGDAASADIMRTMLAEQLATQLARSGKLGIAKMIAAAHPAAKVSDPVAGLSEAGPPPRPIAPPPPVPVPAATVPAAALVD